MKRDNEGNPIAEVCAWCEVGITELDEDLRQSDYTVEHSHGACYSCAEKLEADPSWKGVA